MFIVVPDCVQDQPLVLFTNVAPEESLILQNLPSFRIAIGSLCWDAPPATLGAADVAGVFMAVEAGVAPSAGGPEEEAEGVDASS